MANRKGADVEIILHAMDATARVTTFSLIGTCLAYSGNITIVKCLDTKKAIFGRTFCIQLPKIVTVATWLPCMWQKKQGIFSIFRAHD